MRERSILKHIFGQNARLPHYVTIPPGDDMAGLRIGQEDVLVTVDQLIDGVHFRLEDTPLHLIGRKAMTRNLSDVAAMAALPVAAVAAAALPRSMTEAQATALFEAMRRTSDQYHCPLVGGDISIHGGPLALTVTILATPGGIRPVLRSGARVGDLVCVTGRLGGSWRGVGGVRNSADAPHLNFEPRIQLARQIASIEGLTLHSMIDLSDGIATDLRHICEMSGVGAELDLRALPIRDEAMAAASQDRSTAAWVRALTDSEDYELCFTLAEGEAERLLPATIDGVPITRVGRVIDAMDAPSETPIWLCHSDGSKAPLTYEGWEHKS